MVNGRRREPLPPASRMAFMTAVNDIPTSGPRLGRFDSGVWRVTMAPTFATVVFLMNLPNTLTLSRIFLVPLLVVVLLTKFEGRQILGVDKDLVAAAIFGLASITDWLDGYLARRRKQVTPLGQM